ncbi:MAG: type VI secretion system tube protein Hcp [Acidobacteriota bacterium]
MRKSAIPAIGFVFATVLAVPALGGPIYMQYEGVPGEATTAGHDKWIEVSSIQWATPLPAVPRAPAPAGVASGGPGRVLLMKRVDKASPLLSKAAATGRLVPAVQLDVPKTGGQGSSPYMRYELKNVMVSSFSAGGGGGGTATESLSLNFTRIEFAYEEQKVPPKVAAPYKASTVKR